LFPTIEFIQSADGARGSRRQEFTGQQAVLDGDGRSFDEVAAARVAPE
jgi:hypothetical protein